MRGKYTGELQVDRLNKSIRETLDGQGSDWLTANEAAKYLKARKRRFGV